MNILYIASDIFLPETNGGARRVYETSKVLKDHGHNVSVLINRKECELDFEIINDVHVYRVMMNEIGVKIRNKFRFLKQVIKKILKRSKKKTEVRKDHSNYAIFYQKPSQTIKKDIKNKLIDIYRHKIPIHKYLKIIPAKIKLWNILKKEKIDVIIERGSSYGVGALISKFTNRIYIVDFIDALYSDFALKRADLVLSYTTTYQIPYYVPRNKIKLVYTVADENQFKPQPKNQEILNKLGLKMSDQICMYTGAMYPWHGLDTIVDAIDQLKQRNYPNIKAVLIGDGQERKKIIQLVKKRDLKSHVILTGKIPFLEIPNYLSIADIGLSLNTGDSVGFKLLEYMAAGKAIITTDVDNVHLLAKNNRDIIFTPPDDTEKLVENILKILNNPSLKMQFEINVRKIILKRFTWTAHYFNIMDGLKKTIKIKKER